MNYLRPGNRRGENSALLAVYIERDEYGQNVFMEKARRVLVDTVAKRKANRERNDWLKAKDAADKTFSIRLFESVPSPNKQDRLYVNQAAITALFSNDFAAVEKILAETPAPAHAMA